MPPPSSPAAAGGAPPLKAMIMVAHAAGRGQRRGAGGHEVCSLNTLDLWDRRRVIPLVAYSSHGPLAHLVGAAAGYYDISFTGGALLKNFRRLVGALRDSGAAVVHSYGPVAADFLTVAAARRAGVASVITRPVVIADLKDPAPVKAALRLLDRYTLRAADRVVAICEHGRQALLQDGCPGHKLSVIYNGVDPARFGPEAAPEAELRAWAGGDLLIGMCAQMTPVKRHDLLLAALARGRAQGRRWRVVLAGDGPRRGELERLAGELGVAEAVRMLGFVHRTEAVYAACDLVVLPSDREGFPLTLMEAMSCGRAVAASDAGGTAELIADCGLLLTRGTAGELYQALVRLEDPVLRARLGQAGRAKVQRLYTIEGMIKAQEELYLQAAGARR